ESCALQIAQRLGLAPQLLSRARHEVYGGENADANETSAMKAPRSRLIRAELNKKVKIDAFSMGDSVIVLPRKETGIVYRPADENGDVIVQVRGEKRIVKHTRLQLQIPAAELYPPDYDFSVIFDTVANRKASHMMNKRFDPTVMIVHETIEKPAAER
ncbi:MAG: DNA mismatch repair protein MutS, partial [Bacillota bacterium]